MKTQSKVATSDALEAEIKKKIGPEKSKILDRIILAGMKVMFGKETHKMMEDVLSENLPMPEKLGTGTAKLMMLLFKQGGNSMPQDLILPAGGVLMAKAVEFLIKSGDDVQASDLSEGISVMTKVLLKQFGAPDEVIQKLGGVVSSSLAAVDGAPPQQPQSGMLGQGA